MRTSVFADCVTRLIHGRVHVGSKDKQSRPDSSIQAFNLSRNHAHRETQRDPRLHLPICPHALCDIPHMHSCVILADCARDSVQHGAQLHTHYIYLQTCEGLGVTRAQLICRPAKGLGVKPVSNEQLQYTKCIPWCNTWRAAHAQHNSIVA